MIEDKFASHDGSQIIDPSHIKIELIYRGTGTTERPGGQHAGTPPRDVRITHLPTEIIAQSGCSRSDHKNKMIAMEMIEAALTSKWI